jgi:hypothetical protein
VAQVHAIEVADGQGWSGEGAKQRPISFEDFHGARK